MVNHNSHLFLQTPTSHLFEKNRGVLIKLPDPDVLVPCAAGDVMKLLTMLGAKLSLVFSMVNIVSSLTKSASRGCNLVIPQNVQEHPEPQPESGPLLLHIELSVLHIREIPDSGGSYGMDVW